MNPCAVYIGEIVYVIALALTKASLVFMYLRIFWAYPPFQLACYAVLAFIAIPSAIITLVTILSCDPIAFFWDRDLAGGSCLDVKALAYANSAFAMAQDTILIVLPIFMLWRLNMSRKKKLFITFMFAVGSLGLIATIIRLNTLYVFGNLDDPTWDYVPVVYWTTVELAAGIICSCLPAVRILLERFFKVFQLSTIKSQTSHFRLERQRRPTADAHDDRWKDREWMGDGASQRGLTLVGDGSEPSPKVLPIMRHDFDMGRPAGS